MQLQCMEVALNCLDTIKLHTPDFDYSIDSDSGGPATTNQDIPVGSKLTSPTTDESNEY